MSANMIGTIQFSFIDQLPQDTKMEVEIWRVAGLNGYGAQQLGLGDAEFSLKTVTYFDSASTPDVDDYLDGCNALQGSLQTVLDAWGNEADNVLIMHVDSRNGKKAVIWNGDPDSVRLELDWRMVRMA